MAQRKSPHPEEAAPAAVSKDAPQPIQRSREYFPSPRYPLSEPDSRGLVPAIHEFFGCKTWTPGSRPGMTELVVGVDEPSSDA